MFGTHKKGNDSELNRLQKDFEADFSSKVVRRFILAGQLTNLLATSISLKIAEL